MTGAASNPRELHVSWKALGPEDGDHVEVTIASSLCDRQEWLDATGCPDGKDVWAVEREVAGWLARIYVAASSLIEEEAFWHGCRDEGCQVIRRNTGGREGYIARPGDKRPDQHEYFVSHWVDGCGVSGGCTEGRRDSLDPRWYAVYLRVPKGRRALWVKRAQGWLDEVIEWQVDDPARFGHAP